MCYFLFFFFGILSLVLSESENKGFSRTLVIFMEPFQFHFILVSLFTDFIIVDNFFLFLLFSTMSFSSINSIADSLLPSLAAIRKNHPLEYQVARLSLPTVPATSRQCGLAQIPFGVHLEPFGPAQPDYDELEPARCSKCGGLLVKYECVICESLGLGTFDMKLGSDSSHEPGSCTILTIEVSELAKVQSVFSRLHGNDNITGRIVLLTYDHNSVHFYESGMSGRMVIMSDLEDPFVPLPLDSLAFNPDEFFGSFISNTGYLQNNNEPATSRIKAEIPVVETVLEVASQLLNSSTGSIGKVISIVRLLAPHKSQENEELLMQAPQKYLNLASKFSKKGISLDLFAFGGNINILSQVCQLTGGTEFFYPQYTAERDELIFLDALTHSISAAGNYYNATLELKCSPGIRVKRYLGNLTTRNGVAHIGCLDAQTGIVVELYYQGKSPLQHTPRFQAILVYTDGATRHRRIRIINFVAQKLSMSYNKIVNAADQYAVLSLLVRGTLASLFELTRTELRDQVQQKLVSMLAAYRINSGGGEAGNTEPSTQLVLPASLNVLAVHILGFMNSPLLRSVRLQDDSRIHFGQQLVRSSVYQLSLALYPRVMGLSGLDGQYDTKPVKLLLVNDIFVVYDGLRLPFIYVPRQVIPELVAELFGTADVLALEAYDTQLPVLETPVNEYARRLLIELSAKGFQLAREELDGATYYIYGLMVEDEYVSFLNELHYNVRDYIESKSNWNVWN
jgi:hypothetical protein